MKKGIITASLILGFIFGGFSIASAVNCGSVFPLSLDNYYTGCSIPSSWANALEAKIGIDNSASTTSLDYKVNHISAAGTTTINGTPATSFILKGDGTTITSSVSGATTTFSIPANTYYPYSSNPSNYLTTAITSLNGATSSAQTIAAGTGISVNISKGTSNSTTTITNTGITAINVSSPITSSGGTGPTISCPTCLTGNQTITLTGPMTGSGATSIATTIVSPLTVNVSTTAVTSTNIAAGSLTVTNTSTFNGDAVFSNLTGNRFAIFNSDGSLASWTGLGCAAGEAVTQVGEGGTSISCATYGTSFLSTSTSNTWGGTQTFATSSISHLVLPNITNSFLATDGSGNVTATTTPSALSSFSFVIEYPNVGENDAIWIAPAAATIKSCYAVNKTAGDTVTFNLGYASSRATATSSLTHVFSSDQTVTATTTPTSLTVSNGSLSAGYPLIFYTVAASSTQFSITCSVSM